MAEGLSGYNVTPVSYSGNDGVLFHVKDDMSVFLKLSATTDITYNSDFEVTTQPVQSGQTITDNIQESPKTISINGVVVVGYEGTFFLSKNTTVVEDFITTLEKWRDQKQVMRVMCKDGLTLQACVCKSFQATKNANVSNGLNISLTFQDVDFVVQIGQTQITGDVNGSKATNKSTGKATTTKGSVVSKKVVGKTSTQTTVPTVCNWVRKMVDSNSPSATTGENSFMNSALGGCERGAKMVGGVMKYNEGSGESYIPKDYLKSHGINVSNKG